MTKFQKKATAVQASMVTLMAVVFASLFVFLIPEIRGIVAGGEEDTYSEWVWDLNPWAVYTIATLHILAGVAFIWSGGHFIEGMLRRG